MPEVDINSEEYIKEFLIRLEMLLAHGKICTMKTDDGRWVLCEMWHYPERRETDPDNEWVFYPVAKFLTDEETAELKMEGQTPEKET